MIFIMSNHDWRQGIDFEYSDDDAKPPSKRSPFAKKNDQSNDSGGKNEGDEEASTNEASERTFDTEKASEEMTRLPKNFRPGPNDVICGRGRNVLHHKGNRKYRDLIYASLENYTGASSKVEKSIMVTSIIKVIEDASPEGGFVKKIGDAWYKVSKNYAREKCGQRYKSSSRAKADRRKSSAKETDEISSQVDERINTSNRIFSNSVPGTLEGQSISLYNETELQLRGEMKIQNLSFPSRTQADSVRQSQISFERESARRHKDTKNEGANNVEDDRKISAILQDRSAVAGEHTNQPIPESGIPDVAARSDVARVNNNGSSSDSGDPEGLDLMVKNLFWDDF